MLVFSLVLVSQVFAAVSPVRVRLIEGQPQLGIKGQTLVFQSPVEGLIYSKPQKANIRFDGKRQRWAVKGPLRTDFLARNPVSLGGSELVIDGLALRVPITVLPEDSGHLSVIAEVELERYIEGVLEGEIPASWPLEALKAQAVAARSYALAQMKKRKDNLFHMDATVSDQVFILGDNLEFKWRQKFQKAVQATQGLFLWESSGEPYWAYYHSDCGGETESANDVWGGRRKSPRVRDLDCPASNHSQWEALLPREDVNSKLKSRIPEGTSVLNLRIAGFTNSGRAEAVELQVSNGAILKLSANEFRQIFGFGIIRSTFFEIHKLGKSWSLKGKGWGHGVGLCQWGARALAEKGKNFREILKHYYPDAKLGPGALKLLAQKQ